MTDEKRETIFIRGEGGSIFKLDLPLQPDIQERMEKGYIQRVANKEGDPYVGDDDAVPTERPALNASKKKWVGWAVAESNRRGTPLSPEDADALTKDDLIERYGLDPVATPAAPAAPVDPAAPAAP